MFLGVGSGSHAQQTAQVMMQFEKAVLADRPDWVLVYGDVELHGRRGARVRQAADSGRTRRSRAAVYDREMPEELNRLVTINSPICCSTPSKDGDANLKREGIPADRIHCVGNVMIDTLVRLLPQAKLHEVNLQDKFAWSHCTGRRMSTSPNSCRNSGHVGTNSATVARWSSRFTRGPATDGRHRLRQADRRTFPAARTAGLSRMPRAPKARDCDRHRLWRNSGRIDVPRRAVSHPRENTERPITIDEGTNQLIGGDMPKLLVEFDKILNGKGKRGRCPALWEGKASERIADILTGVKTQQIRRAA